MHMTCLVIGPTDDESLAEALDPYNEQEHRTERQVDDGEEWFTNPDGHWDWWEVGGRWPGLLRLLPGHVRAEAPRFSWGWPDHEKLEIIADPSRADRAEAGQVDWEATGGTYALLVPGEGWIEKPWGEWWSDLHDPPRWTGSFTRAECQAKDEVLDAEWQRKLLGIVSAIPPTTTVTVVDYHR